LNEFLIQKHTFFINIFKQIKIFIMKNLSQKLKVISKKNLSNVKAGTATIIIIETDSA